MTNEELLAKIKTEIEKRLKNTRDYMNGAGMKYKGPKYHASRGRESAYDAILSFLSTLESEKPSEELEKEVKRYLQEEHDRDTTVGDVARHFYDLGCRRAAEKYNEIEYNRQRAEESEKPIDGLEEEIIKCWQEWVSPSNKQSVEGVLPLSEFAFYARHFAEWGAEHPKK